MIPGVLNKDEIMVSCVVCIALIDSIKLDINKVEEIKIGDRIPASDLTLTKIHLLQSVVETIRDDIPPEFKHIADMAASITIGSTTEDTENGETEPSKDN